MPTESRIETSRPRDVRLDFFRGIGMFIIYVAHIPNNPWSGWIPARFGFSDATEIFVFCSGMASAIAFAKIFDNSGFWLGCARILHRCWQVYWAHICLFLAAVALMEGADRFFGTGVSYVNGINLVRFLDTDTGAGIVGLLTLTYVPNLFDILPMYLVILLLIPIVMALSRLGPWAPIVFCLSLWLIATLGYWQFPAEPWSDRRWFFHPLAWQLVFFTGFAFIRGWLPQPPITKPLIALAVAVVVVNMLLVVPSLTPLLPVPYAWTRMPDLIIDKTLFGVLRYIHFLALAYLAFAAAGPQGARLTGWFVDICRRVGQQALAVFIASMIAALVGGVALSRLDYTPIAVASVNLAGFAVLIAVAYTVGWFKSSPWKSRTRQTIPMDARPLAAE